MTVLNYATRTHHDENRSFLGVGEAQAPRSLVINKGKIFIAGREVGVVRICRRCLKKFYAHNKSRPGRKYSGRRLESRFARFNAVMCSRKCSRNLEDI